MKVINKIKKLICTMLGILCLVLAFLGVLLPILPTAPFVLLASILFAQNDKIKNKLLKSKLFGDFFLDKEKRQGLSLGVKCFLIVLCWVSITFSICLVNKTVATLILFAIGIITTISLLFSKTKTIDKWYLKVICFKNWCLF